MSSSQLTNSYFFRGIQTTNQILLTIINHRITININHYSPGILTNQDGRYTTNQSLLLPLATLHDPFASRPNRCCSPRSFDALRCDKIESSRVVGKKWFLFRDVMDISHRCFFDGHGAWDFTEGSSHLKNYPLVNVYSLLLKIAIYSEFSH